MPFLNLGRINPSTMVPTHGAGGMNPPIRGGQAGLTGFRNYSPPASLETQRSQSIFVFLLSVVRGRKAKGTSPAGKFFEYIL